MLTRTALLSILTASIAFTACTSARDRIPQVAEIYRDAALDPVRNPVIVIHGILGARLQQRSTGKVVWGAFTSEGIDPNSAEGSRAVALPLRVPGSAFDYDPEVEDVYASGPLEKLELSFLYTVLTVEVYAQIIRTLGAGGYTDEVVAASPGYASDHFTCHSFFYDWRRDNVENAIRLGKYIEAKRLEIDASARDKIARLRRDGDDEQADRLQAWLDKGYRFDIVAHSMGGLVARYFLRHGANDLPADGSTPTVTWEGANEIDRLICVGTPSLGSMFAFQRLEEGFAPAAILPHFDPALLGSMPAIYQLLPRVRHNVLVDEDGEPVDIDFMDVREWERNRWGMFGPGKDRLSWLLPDLDEDERMARAREYVGWCLRRARQFHAALDVRPAAPCPSQLFLFAGDVVPTLSRARLVPRDDGTHRLRFSGDGLFEDGDQTVARYSAVGDERFGNAYRSRVRTPVPWTNVTFLADDHIGLTSNPNFADNMLFLLLDWAPRMR